MSKIINFGTTARTKLKNGIDILAKDAIINFIKTINADRKVTFILTTHDIADIETLCEKVTIINHGTVVFDDYLLELKKYFENKRIIDLIFNQLVKPSCLKEFDVKKVIYGHLHGPVLMGNLLNGYVDGIEYILSSADYINFNPKRIL